MSLTVIPGLLRRASKGSWVSEKERAKGFCCFPLVKPVFYPFHVFKLFLGCKRKKAVENLSEFFPTMIKYSEKVDSFLIVCEKG